MALLSAVVKGVAFPDRSVTRAKSRHMITVSIALSVCQGVARAMSVPRRLNAWKRARVILIALTNLAAPLVTVQAILRYVSRGLKKCLIFASRQMSASQPAA